MSLHQPRYKFIFIYINGIQFISHTEPELQLITPECSRLYSLWYTRKKWTPGLYLHNYFYPIVLLYPLFTFYTTFFCISLIELQNTFLSCLLHLSNAVDCWAHFKIWLNRQEKCVVAKAQLPQLYLFQWDYFRLCLAEPYGLTHYCFGALAVLPDHVFQYSFAWKGSTSHTP